MRHYYKSHGKHCYLRSFQSKCPKCNADVLYWECTHGSKVFFEYPPYGKLVRHFCRHNKSIFKIKNKFPVIVKKPKGLLENQSLSCPICGKLFKNDESFENHLQNLKKNDKYHNQFFENRISFKTEKLQKDLGSMKSHDQPEFGKINVRKEKKIG